MPWENIDDEKVLEEAHAEIRRCYPDGNPPPILDPFCGGGSIPLEAQRLGLEAHASDLNPVAVLINKALIEIPPKFAGRPPVHPGRWHDLQGTQSWRRRARASPRTSATTASGCATRPRRRIGHLYPKANLPDGTQATVIAWIWARTVTCPNPACRRRCRSSRSFWLGKKKGKEAWYVPFPIPDGKRVRFEIGTAQRVPTRWNSQSHRRRSACCAAHQCRSTYIRTEGKAGRMGAQLMAIVAEGKRQRVLSAPDARARACSERCRDRMTYLTRNCPSKPSASVVQATA